MRADKLLKPTRKATKNSQCKRMLRANEPRQMNLQENSRGILLACHVSKSQSTWARAGAKLTDNHSG